jgi:hypothetical protein
VDPDATPIFVEGRRINVFDEPHRQLVGICTPANRPGEYETVFELRQIGRVAWESLAERDSLSALTDWLLTHGANDLGPSDLRPAHQPGLAPTSLDPPDLDPPSLASAGFAPNGSNEPSAPPPTRPPAPQPPSTQPPATRTPAPQPPAPQRPSPRPSSAAPGPARPSSTAPGPAPAASAPAPPDSPPPTADQADQAIVSRIIAALISIDRLENEVVRVTSAMREIRNAVLQDLAQLQAAGPLPPAPAVEHVTGPGDEADLTELSWAVDPVTAVPAGSPGADTGPRINMAASDLLSLIEASQRHAQHAPVRPARDAYQSRRLDDAQASPGR